MFVLKITLVQFQLSLLFLKRNPRSKLSPKNYIKYKNSNKFGPLLCFAHFMLPKILYLSAINNKRKKKERKGKNYG